MTTILALDLGTTTGWALRGSDGHHRQRFRAFPAATLRRRRDAFCASNAGSPRSNNPATASIACISKRCAATLASMRRTLRRVLATLTAWCEHQIPVPGACRSARSKTRPARAMRART